MRPVPRTISSLAALALLALTATTAPAQERRLAVHDEDRFAAPRATDSTDLLDQPARLEVEDVPLEAALIELHHGSGVPLVFSEAFLPSRGTVSCECQTMTVEEALDRLLDGTDLRYVELGSQVVIEQEPQGLSIEAWPPGPGTFRPVLAAVQLPRPAADLRRPRIRQGTVIGQVTSAGTGEPLPGVQVSIPGSGLGTLTDNDGRYVLPSVPPGEVIVRAQLIGYATAEQSVTVSEGQSSTANFQLTEQAVALDEVIATVEAGQVTRREVGVDIASIDVEEQIDQAVVTDLSEFLNARAPNVTITDASGNVGSGSRIRIRGINSLTQSNQPLLIVDGVRVSNNTDVGVNRGQTFSRFNDLDPNNIARIQVVKGPAALALYGSEAASGVIIVETKTGSAAEDAMEITLSVERGSMRDVTDYPDNLADVTPFVTGPDDPLLDGWETEQHPLTGQVFVVDNPYEDASTSPFRTGETTNTGIEVSGRSDAVNYFTSLSYEEQLGTLPSNDLERLNFRANFRAMPNEQVTLTASSGYINSTINLPKSGNNTSGFFANAVGGIPLASRNDEGECLATLLTLADADPTNDTDPSFCDKEGNQRAAFPKIAAIISREDLERFVGSLSLDYRPFSWLTNSATLGADVADQVFHDAIPYDPDIPFSFAAGGEYFRTRFLRRHVTADLSSTAEYRLSSSLGANTAIGAQYFQDLSEMIACEGREFVNDQATACDAGVSLRGFSGLTEKVEIGAYAQQRFNFNNYFFATGALRVDDNSALGVEAPPIWSPSFNTSLVVSDLPMWNVDPTLLSQLRLRAAWGTASQSPPAYSALRTFGVVRLAQQGDIVPGLSPEDPGNPELGPERSSEIEVGFDASVFQDRIGFDFTYYRRTTTDAIVPRPVPPSSGFADSRLVNLGELENVGYEATLSALLFETEDASWNATLTASSTKATITDLGEAEGFGGFREGYAPGSLTSCVITAAERGTDGNILPESIEHLPGTLEEGSCLRVVGQSTPTNEQSLFTTLTLFNNIQISALFDRAAGHLLYSGTLDGHEPNNVGGVESAFGRMWAYRQMRSTPIEQAYMEQDFFEGNHNAIWYHPADFIKFRELKAAYSFPQDLAARMGMSRAQLYVGARNLVTWTDYPGIDPEINERGARDEISTEESGALAPPFMVFTGLRVTF